MRFERKSPWIAVERKRVSDRSSVRWEESISLFVDNLLGSMSLDWLRSFSSSFGRVADIFVPASDRRGKGKCFDFVHFRERRAFMNGSYVGRRKITRSIAKSGWNLD